jgi:hypothetical protein
LNIVWTETQIARLKELGAEEKDQGRGFETEKDRDNAFQILEKNLARSERQKLDELRAGHRRPRLCRLESRLTKVLMDNGFVQVDDADHYVQRVTGKNVD